MIKKILILFSILPVLQAKSADSSIITDREKLNIFCYLDFSALYQSNTIEYDVSDIISFEARKEQIEFHYNKIKTKINSIINSKNINGIKLIKELIFCMNYFLKNQKDKFVLLNNLNAIRKIAEFDLNIDYLENS